MSCSRGMFGSSASTASCVGQFEGELELQEGRPAVGGLHVHDHVGHGVEEHAVGAFADGAGAPSSSLPPFFVLPCLFFFFLPCLPPFSACAASGLGFRNMKAAAAAAAQHHERAGAGDDQHLQRQLLLGRSLALALGSPSAAPRLRGFLDLLLRPRAAFLRTLSPRIVNRPLWLRSGF